MRPYFICLAVGIGMASCSSDEGGIYKPFCAADSVQACTCPGGGTGTRRCASDGSKFGECTSCTPGATGGAGGGAAGRGGTAGSGGSVPDASGPGGGSVTGGAGGTNGAGTGGSAAGGTNGAAGNGGSAGSAAGTSGTAGSNGAAGTAGTSGVAGSSGTADSGVDGSSGTAGGGGAGGAPVDGGSGSGGTAGSGTVTCGIPNPVTCQNGQVCCVLHPDGLDQCMLPTAACQCATGSNCNAFQAACDGPEDCPASQSCCGLLDANATFYTRLACQTSCLFANNQRQICHGNTDCRESGHICTTSTALPTNLMRCRPP